VRRAGFTSYCDTSQAKKYCSYVGFSVIWPKSYVIKRQIATNRPFKMMTNAKMLNSAPQIHKTLISLYIQYF